MDDLPTFQTITLSREGPVLVTTLNRPDSLNAVDPTMHGELPYAFRAADRDPASNAVVLTGAGRAFCAGGDVKRMATGEPSTMIHSAAGVRGEAHDIVESLLSIEKPIVAMVNGPAVGLGATIALLCDVIVAAEDAKIGDTHVNVGLVAGDGGAIIWPSLIGVARAKEYLMTGRLLTGKEAADLGLVNRAVPLEDLRAYVMELANELAAKAPYAVRATKAAVNRILKQRVLELLDVSLAWEQLSMAMPDHREASSAFMEKRPPKFGRR